MFICAKWINIWNAHNRLLVARCDKSDGHVGPHCDSVILVGWNDDDPRQNGEEGSFSKPEIRLDVRSSHFLVSALAELHELKALLNTPEIEDFDKAVPLEAAHQIQRWGAAADAGKSPEDWFWLCGYLAGKALAAFKAGDMVKAKHHCVSTGAAMRNWHAHIRSGESAMRPGIAEEKAAIVEEES